MHANAFARVVLLLGLAAPAALFAGCGTRASVVCSLECECEHCNDYAEAVRCESYETSEEVAAVYGCEAQWDAWTVCFEEQGRCEEADVTYTTRAAGSCSGMESLGTTCMSDNDCNGGGPDQFCSAGTCMRRVCAGTNDGCETNLDCSGEDRCDAQINALDECINNASGHNGTNFDFD